MPELFAPGIIGTGMYTRDIAMPPSGDEILFCISLGNYSYTAILHVWQDEGIWKGPELVPFSSGAKIFDFEPSFSPDGSRLYFPSTRADGDEEPGDQDIWYTDRTDNGWSEPVNPGEPLNTDGGEFFPSLTRDGYLYFTHSDKGSNLNEIFRSRINGDSFGKPERLPEQVNCGTNRFNVFVSPDHSFAIIPALGMEDAYDQVDYYISFRNKEDRWSTPINMGPAINKDNTRGWSAYLSPDGKYLFFMSNRSEEIPDEEWNYARLKQLYNEPGNGNSDIYWMSAGFIEDLRAKATFE
jgi:Tol biopolymer transport system component